jgi:hypothetical protein
MKIKKGKKMVTPKKTKEEKMIKEREVMMKEMINKRRGTKC